jgi:hypothetical protein
MISIVNYLFETKENTAIKNEEQALGSKFDHIKTDNGEWVRLHNHVRYGHRGNLVYADRKKDGNVYYSMPDKEYYEGPGNGFKIINKDYKKHEDHYNAKKSRYEMKL